ncbi:hypothetical protein [Sediminihaliea albiluteola]|nr:hypothetical protein [Sediminihaliea albiluteola]
MYVLGAVGLITLLLAVFVFSAAARKYISGGDKDPDKKNGEP